MRLIKTLITGYTGFFISLLLTGIALIGWGTDISSPFLTSLGGALLGTSIGALIGSLRNDSFTLEIKEILKNSLSSDFSSEDNKLEPYRYKFHYYDVTEVKAMPVWRYEVFDFTKSAEIGKLTTTYESLVKASGNHKYKVYAGLRDKRYILFRKAAIGDESTSVAVFPHMGQEYHNYHCGLVFKESWDGTNLVAPCIMSRTPISNWTKRGIIAEEVAKSFDEIWKEGFLSLNKIPRFKIES